MKSHENGLITKEHISNDGHFIIQSLSTKTNCRPVFRSFDFKCLIIYLRTTAEMILTMK